MTKVAKGLLSSIVLFAGLLTVSAFSGDDASAITQKGYVHAANEWYISTYN
ncbi:TPA: hypothetical protein ACUI23_001734 [Staphylococcus pseudintermedius]